MAENLDSSSKMEHKLSEAGVRAEIDTSAPFESVKEAVSRFGGIGYWKPSQHKLSEAQHDMEAVDIGKVEDQAFLLEKELIPKERETLEVLKELEATKMVVDELKLKLQKEASEGKLTLDLSSVNENVVPDLNSGNENMTPVVKEAQMESHENLEGANQNLVGGLNTCPSSAPGLILMELKQAKLNLSRTTTDLADIRAFVESLNKKLEEERLSLEKTCERLSLNSSKVSSPEEELNQTRLKLQMTKDASGSDNAIDISGELQRLSSEAEHFKKMGKTATSEVLRAISEIEQTQTEFKTAEMRLVVARKMMDAAKAAEAVALADIKVLSNCESLFMLLTPKPEGVTLTYEEYSCLTCKAQDAQELSRRRVVDVMLQVDKANVSKSEILKKVEEATEEVKTGKKALEEALNRVEAANRGKLAVEEALRKWRSENGQKRHSIHNSTKFKNAYPSDHQEDSHLHDVNGLNMVSNGPTPIVKPTLSIGQILSRKLLLPEELEMDKKGTGKRKVSLGQILSKQNGDMSSSHIAEKENCSKQFSGKRTKFGFPQFSLVLAMQNKKKKPTLNLR